MKLLALDTTTEACSAALHIDNAIIEVYELAPRRHAEIILGMIDGLLAEAGMTLNMLDALAFGRGPGAFTGLRISAGIVQGLAFGAELPVVPVSTLAALAQSADSDSQYLVSAIDARMGEIYWCIYRRDSDGMVCAVTDEQVSLPGQLLLPNPPGSCFGIGSGWATYHDTLSAVTGKDLTGFNGDCFPRSRHILELAVPELRQGNTIAADRVAPVYLRNKVTG